MQYYSTNNLSKPVNFREAVIKGLPEDNGLYMPQHTPTLAPAFLQELPKLSLPEIGYEVVKPFVGSEIPHSHLQNLITETLSFDIPLNFVEEGVYVLELFHGPTLAFKDIGARFLARCLGFFSATNDKKITVLAATSGDTGSAVAHGFLGVDNVEVVILYPKGKVSHIQEQQLTTLGQNITALEVSGNFDDCQQMVKSAFLDKTLNQHLALTSANSINIARLLPQSFYYFWALSQLGDNSRPVTVAVPSGNYGNLSAGLLARQMGLPIRQFIAASNANDIVPVYLKSSKFMPKPSIQTIANAMDVGNPSNFVRMKALFGDSYEKMCQAVQGFSFSDEETKTGITNIHQQTGYLMDPHGAIAYLALKEAIKGADTTGIFLETAHPVKFKDVVEPTIGQTLDIPERLKAYLKKEKKSIPIKNTFEALKEFLMDH